MKKIDYHPEVFVIEDFLAKEDCENLIQRSERIGFEEAKVQLGEGVQTMMKTVRNNDRILFENEELASDFWQKARDFLPKEKGTYTLLGLNEMFRFYRYTSGQRFKMHRDGSFERNETECSFYTFMIYLNDDFEGGETKFQDLFTINPKQGSLLVFYHPLRHEGKPIVSGTKYVLRSDVMYKLHL